MADQRNKGNRMNRLKYSLAIIAIVAADVILILNIPSDVWDFISKFFEIMSSPNKFVEKCSAQSAAECVASLLGNPERIEAIDRSINMLSSISGLLAIALFVCTWFRIKDAGKPDWSLLFLFIPVFNLIYILMLMFKYKSVESSACRQS